MSSQNPGPGASRLESVQRDGVNSKLEYAATEYIDWIYLQVHVYTGPPSVPLLFVPHGQAGFVRCIVYTVCMHCIVYFVYVYTVFTSLSNNSKTSWTTLVPRSFF